MLLIDIVQEQDSDQNQTDSSQYWLSTYGNVTFPNHSTLLCSISSAVKWASQEQLLWTNVVRRKCVDLCVALRRVEGHGDLLLVLSAIILFMLLLSVMQIICN